MRYPEQPITSWGLVQALRTLTCSTSVCDADYASIRRHVLKVGCHADSAMHCCAFSHDGSTLAVGGASCTTLWTQHNKFVASLVCPFQDSPDSRVSHVCFVQGSPYLVTAHSGARDDCQGLCVWNLLTLTLQWAGHGPVHDLAAHPTLQQFACVFGKGQNRVVAELEASGGGLIRSWGEAASDRPARVLYGPAGSALSACRLGSTPLLVVSEGRRVMVIASASQGADQIEAARDSREGGESAGNLKSSGKRDGKLLEMFGDDRAESGGLEGEEMDVKVKRRERAAALAAVLPFQAESHLLPPPSELCSRILWTLAGAGVDAA